MSETNLSDEERKAYAAHAMKQAAKEPDFVGLFEAYGEYGEYDVDLSDADGRAVDDLIRAAEVTIAFPETPPVG